MKHYDTKAILDYTGISRSTLHRWTKASLVPSPQKLRNGRVRYTEEQLIAIQKYIESLEEPMEEVSVKQHNTTKHKVKQKDKVASASVYRQKGKLKVFKKD